MKILFPILAILSLSCCSLKKMAVKETANIMYAGMGAYLEEKDLQTARETMLSAVKMAESTLKSDPKNEKLLELISKGYCGYGFAFIEDENPERANTMYKKGLDCSTALLTQKKLLINGKLDSSDISVKDTPIVFWYAFCMSGYIKLNLDKPAVLTRISELRNITDILIKLNPAYYYNSPYALKGTLLARSPMLGGNYDKSKYYFDMALKGQGGKFKINKFLYASFYARQTLNRKLFEKLLNEIITEPDLLSGESMLNNAAKQKARRLLEKTDEIF